MERPFVVAIDAQISPAKAGGTETALMSLIGAFCSERPQVDLVVIGLKGYAQLMTPYLPKTVRRITWPVHYSWYLPVAKRLRKSGPRTALLARLVGQERAAELRRRFVARPLSPRARCLAEKGFGLDRVIPHVFRLYTGLRHGKPGLTTPAADKLLRAQGAEVVHFPYPHYFQTSLPFVYEPWGLPHIHQPDMFGPEEVIWMDKLFGSGCREATMIVTASRWVKNDIVRQYGVAPERIAVIPRTPMLHETDTDNVALPEGLPARFALYPSVTWPSKNHLKLIRGLAILRDEHGVTVNLVCTGLTNTANFPEIEREIAQLGLQAQVTFLGVVSREQLVALFRRAAYLVHPSTFEGLGLPLLEAFQYDLPVLSSTAACKPEVVGDAAILFDPADERDMAAAMLKAESDPLLLERLREAGRRRLKESFPSPGQMADMFLTVYRKAAGRQLDAAQASLLKQMLAP